MMGSSKSSKLDELSKTIWAWRREKNTWLSMARTAGCKNVEADCESRHINIELSGN